MTLFKLKNIFISFLITITFVSVSHTKPLKKYVDIIIKNGLIITMDSKKTVFEEGTIVINNGVIVKIGNSQVLKNKFKAKKIYDATGKIIMPGLINTHTHAAMTLFRGFADDLSLLDWLQNYIWPLEKKYIDEEAVYIGTKLAIIEMLHSGITTFNDMYFFEDQVARAAKDLGMRVVIGEGLLDFPTPNKKTPDEGLKYIEKLIHKWKNDPLVNISVACHASYTCSADLLKRGKKLSDKYNIPFHIHVAETKTEVDRINKKYSLSPVEYLDSLKILDKNVIVVHGIHLTKKDIELLVKHDVKLSHNPSSNMKLASGV